MILWQKCGKRELAIAAAGLSILLLAFSFINSSSSDHFSDHFSGAGETITTDFVPLVLLSNAVQRGACNFFFLYLFNLYVTFDCFNVVVNLNLL